MSNCMATMKNKLKKINKYEVDCIISKLLHEFANTPLDKRETGWQWLLKVRKLINEYEK